ncbi:MAG: PepSY domain-containing protein [Alphaproteobacteria bacterium]|nr:PepSY domain-containing protein [Alphaproteobacteria bacterium]
MRKTTIVASVILATAAGSAAFAGSLDRPCTAAPKDKWLSMEQLKAKVEAQGYKVSKAKMKNSCAEMYTLDPSGARVELFLDPASGDVVAKL